MWGTFMLSFSFTLAPVAASAPLAADCLFELCPVELPRCEGPVRHFAHQSTMRRGIAGASKQTPDGEQLADSIWQLLRYMLFARHRSRESLRAGLSCSAQERALIKPKQFCRTNTWGPAAKCTARGSCSAAVGLATALPLSERGGLMQSDCVQGGFVGHVGSDKVHLIREWKCSGTGVQPQELCGFPPRGSSGRNATLAGGTAAAAAAAAPGEWTPQTCGRWALRRR